MKLIKLNSLCYCVAVDESLVISFGSPPEWIKLAGGIAFPRYIFLGGTLLNNGYNYCEIEFPIYRNFFFNRQTKTHIVAPVENIDGLKNNTEEALLGPGLYDDDIAAGIFVSHIHADHDQGLYRFLSLNPSIPVYSCGLVHDSLHRKISFLSGQKAAEDYNLVKLETGRLNTLPGLEIDVACDYGFHSIPSAMMKLYFRSGSARGTVLGYSGDTLYDPIRFRSEEFPREYGEQIEGFFNDAGIIVHEAGAGLIHTDPEDLIPFLDEKKRLLWFHTPRTNDNGFSRGLILEKGRWVELG